jgi:hypothetical protein
VPIPIPKRPSGYVKGAARVALQRLFSNANVLRVHFVKQQSRTAKRRTSPVLANHFLPIF